MKNSHSKGYSQGCKGDDNCIKGDKEYKLEYALFILGLNDLIPLFQSMKLTFIDFLLLSKQDVIKLNLELYQRNRILNFIQCYQKTGIEYSFDELISFFNHQKKFIFIQLSQPISHQSGSLLIDKLLNNKYKDSTSSCAMKSLQVNNNLNSEEIEDEQSRGRDKEEIRKLKEEDRSTINRLKANGVNNKKKLSHSQTVNPAMRKSFKANDDPFYQSFIKMSKDTDIILNNLRRAKEESESKQLKYFSLLHKNSHLIAEGNSSRYASNKSVKEDEGLLQSGKLNENNKEENNENSIKEGNDINQVSNDIKKLYEMINKKESLMRNLNECNKSITEKKKVFILLFLILFY